MNQILRKNNKVLSKGAKRENFKKKAKKALATFSLIYENENVKLSSFIPAMVCSFIMFFEIFPTELMILPFTVCVIIIILFNLEDFKIN